MTLDTLVYGTHTGSYLLLDCPTGIIPPPLISDHPLLGTVSDMAAALNYHEKQSITAEALGVSQQEVSRWANGDASTRNPLRIPELVRRYTALCAQAPEHIHTREMYRANAHADRRKP